MPNQFAKQIYPAYIVFSKGTYVLKVCIWLVLNPKFVVLVSSGTSKVTQNNYKFILLLELISWNYLRVSYLGEDKVGKGDSVETDNFLMAPGPLKFETVIILYGKSWPPEFQRSGLF